MASDPTELKLFAKHKDVHMCSDLASLEFMYMWSSPPTSLVAERCNAAEAQSKYSEGLVMQLC